MKCIVLIFIMFIFSCPVFSGHSTSQPVSEPSIGLTLSGGGARGLAHVGVLHILDSLGIRIDYITGTSMGSVVGGMYAAGYTAAEIEEFALGMNWDALFAGNTDLSYIHPVNRNDFKKFIIELPIENGKIQFSTGAIEGQQLWNILNEVFLHTYGIADFNKLDIPFACVATDVERGEAVVMRDGNLVTAIRASMAIPSVFTTVNRDGYKLIDGGVTNNFPVALAKEMGADYVIGVNVSQGLRPANELLTPIDVIYQMGFFSDARKFIENRKMTDIYIEPDLEGFTAASFAQMMAIIEQGKIAARDIIDTIIHYQNTKMQATRTTLISKEEFSLTIDSIQFNGLNNVRPLFAQNTMNIHQGDTIDAKSLTTAVNRLFATGYFERVHYKLIDCDQTACVILSLDVQEKPFGSLAAALQYNSFTGVGISGKIATNKLFLYNARASASLLIGEKPAFRTKIRYFTNDRRHSWISLTAHGRYITFPLYEDFKAISEYQQGFLRSELSFNTLSGKNSFFSFTGGYYYQRLSPNMQSPVTIEGKTSAFTAGINWQHHSLSSNTFPTQGQLIIIKNNFYFNQTPSFSEININGKPSTLEELDIRIRNFVQTQIRWESYTPINERLTQHTRLQLGYNIKYEQGFINSFNLGGTYPYLENQITFTGLNEYELVSENILAAALGYQYHIGRSVYATALANAALFDFSFGRPEEFSASKLVYGAGLSIGYNSFVGPFEVTFSYSPQTEKVIGYVNLGWMF
jgi:NTE family protein